MHANLKWSAQNNTAFGNWFGLYCDSCGQIIPCVRNLTSYLLLGLTFPIWFWFKDKWKKNWLEEQKVKFSQPMTLNPPVIKWYRGVIWGLVMYGLNAILLPIVDGKELHLPRLLWELPMWVGTGILFALFMQMIYGRKKSAATESWSQTQQSQ